MIRDLKILLAAMVALWGLFGALGNASHLDQAYEAVRAVTAMEGLGAPHATENAFVVWLGVALIIAGKLGAAIFGGWGTVRMARTRRAPAAEFARAKTLAILGAGLAVAMLFGGFIVIGETVFQMWQSEHGTVAASGAFRYGGFLALIMIFLSQADG